jgi:hypothetical protein
MRPATCHLLAAVDVQERCPGEPCAYWDKRCLLPELRTEMSTNPLLVPSKIVGRHLAPFLAAEPQ